MLDACGPLCKYGDALKMLVGLMVEELCLLHCDKERKRRAATVGRPPRWAIQLDSDAQQEFETQIRNLEELRLEKVMRLSVTTLSGFGAELA